jgi:hypothetical protein
MKIFAYLASIATVVLTLVGCGGSQKPVMTQTRQVNLSLHFDTTRGISEIVGVKVYVTGREIVSMIEGDFAKNASTGIWSASVAVPTGLDREFTVEASDAFQVIYRGTAKNDVSADNTTAITIKVYPDLRTTGLASLKLSFYEPFAGIGKIPLSLGNIAQAGQMSLSAITDEQVSQQMDAMSKYCSIVKSQGNQSNNEFIAKYAIKYGMGCWLEIIPGADAEVNRIAFENLAATITKYPVIGIIILDYDTLTHDEATTYINMLKGAQNNVIVAAGVEIGPVITTTFSWSDLTDTVVGNCTNFTGEVDDATAKLTANYNTVSNAYPGKTIILDGLGWSSDNAVDQRRFLQAVTMWASQNGIQYFYAEFFDQSSQRFKYKHFGLFDENLVIKPEIKKIWF